MNDDLQHNRRLSSPSSQHWKLFISFFSICRDYWAKPKMISGRSSAEFGGRQIEESKLVRPFPRHSGEVKHLGGEGGQAAHFRPSNDDVKFYSFGKELQSLSTRVSTSQQKQRVRNKAQYIFVILIWKAHSFCMFRPSIHACIHICFEPLPRLWVT